MKEVDYGVVASIMAHLRSYLEEGVPLYQYVPGTPSLPYVVLEVGQIGEGNGLPPPHFQAKVQFQIHVWSSYQGVREMQGIMKILGNAVDHQRCALGEGEALLRLGHMRLEGQQESSRQHLRKGILDCVAHVFLF